MAVLIKNAADHRRHERAIRERPIGNREAGIVGGDQGAGDEQEKRAASGEDSEAVNVPGRPEEPAGNVGANCTRRIQGSVTRSEAAEGRGTNPALRRVD